MAKQSKASAAADATAPTTTEAPSAPAAPAPPIMVDGVPIATVRAAVEKNRGGWAGAEEDAVIRLWRSLPDDVRDQYIKSLQQKQAEAENK